ncbi:hypothetical protein [Deinococcus radiophilus]|uniref:hypothetical protein n=1 Tax=Deinococcus radiophilus TaxID=32062 RepID=UPI001E5EEAB2|nr:hypothetical protein [Deinococcus radiophilus]UFA50836.1 hypothetical protein LMT64_02715 [Deinococcus radiophilus]
MIWAQERPTLDEVRANLAGAEERFTTGEQLRYHAWDRSGQTFIGSSGFPRWTGVYPGAKSVTGSPPHTLDRGMPWKWPRP